MNGELGVGVTTHVCYCEKVAAHPPEAISCEGNRALINEGKTVCASLLTGKQLAYLTLKLPVENWIEMYDRVTGG